MSLKSWTDFSTICMSYYHSQSELCVSSTVECQTLNFQLSTLFVLMFSWINLTDTENIIFLQKCYYSNINK